MKILLITDGVYPIVIGGMQKHSYYVAKFLSHNNVSVFLVHSQSEDPINDDKKISELADFNTNNISFKTYPFPSLGKLPGHYIRENKRYSENVYADFKDRFNEFDLIYCKGFTGWKFIKESKKGNVPIPIISNLHGYEMFQIAPSIKVKLEHYLMRGIARYISINSDFVFSYGGKITDIISNLGTPKNKILECNTGIENEWVGEARPLAENKLIRFVFVGRNERRKGIYELSAALKLLIAEKKDNFEFHFIGDISVENRIESKNIIYHGQLLGDNKIKEVLNTCDVLVCPSYSEGMPNVIVEGMACGLAVIGTDVGAVSGQIKDNGWLIPNAHVETIKSAIESALNTSKSELLKLKNNSISSVNERFLWERVIQHKIECFNYAIKEYKKVGN